MSVRKSANSRIPYTQEYSGQFLPIGSRFYWMDTNEFYEVVEAEREVCEGCGLISVCHGNFDDKFPLCTKYSREDHLPVIFKKYDP